MDNNPDDFAKLEQGWDSYNGKPTDQKLIDKAKKIAKALEGQFTVDPWFVPASGGDIQIEYHEKGVVTEVYIYNDHPSPSVDIKPTVK